MAAGASQTVVRRTGTQPGQGPDRDSAANLNGAHATKPCCNLYHRAVELVGKRWTGAILLVMLDGPLRFSEVRALVPDISDRLLSERLKELEAEAIVERRVIDCAPIRVEYALTEKGTALEPAVRALKAWAGDWLC